MKCTLLSPEELSMSKWFRQFGLTVVFRRIWLTNESELISYLEDERPDMIILSIDERELSFLRMTRMIQENQPKAKIIWISSQEYYALMAFHENISYFMKLPFTYEVMETFSKKMKLWEQENAVLRKE